MRFLTSLAILCVQFATGAMASGMPFTGDWQYLDSSPQISKDCWSTTYQFTEDGFFLIDDGSLHMKKSFVATGQERGYLVVVKTIALTGSVSCQKLPASNFKIGAEDPLFVEVLNGGRNLKLTYEPKGGGPGGYVLLERQKKWLRKFEELFK